MALTPQKPTAPRLHWAVMLLLVTWLIPLAVFVGPVRLTPYRLALLVLFIPCVTWLLQGRAGRVRLPDILLVLFAIWTVISLVVIHGLEGIQTGGIQVLETLTPYFLARCCIRNADDFYAFAKVLTWIVAALLPFAIYEATSGHNLYLEIASHIGSSIGVTDKDPRWGLRRVQLFFEHPILMGVCLGSVFALTNMVVGRRLSFTRRWMASGVVFVTAALSLSSGPLSGLVMQLALMTWNRALGWLRARWALLLSLIGLFVVAVELFAKRPLPNILLSFAFDPDSAFFRIVIWTYGSQSVANHPWFGVGMGRWDHPSWMAPSIDMFWLYNAITYGLPGGLLMVAFFLAACATVGATRHLTPVHYDYRAAYLMAMASFFLTGWMVHFWNGTYVFFLLMVGAGMWLRDVPEAQPKPARLRAGAAQHRRPQRLLDPELEPVEREARRRR
ncbi:O-antigen ligase domain-containing protein [Devosia sp.]|uniref:O-antigen ligase family protein n=1 Tax=Devosia sp. TaxID=1871048 RepID=UPI001AC7B62D|nr:O-antigen ligase domain-containing protein [Devosia sp.]MBN9334776.1 O-antigen ligase domain-containing protein [Devosia sp.]